jgi:N-methylhydantoinase A
VIFPPLASVYSAFGSLVTPKRLDLVRSAVTRVGQLDRGVLAAQFDDMESEGRRALVDSGCAAEEIALRYAADMRYVGQQYELAVEFPQRPDGPDAATLLRSAFEAQYEKRYKLTQSDIEVEVVNWRLTVMAHDAGAEGLTLIDPVSGPRAARSRTVHLWQSGQSVPVIARRALTVGEVLDGPAIIEEAETTLVIPPGWRARMDDLGSVIATRTKP